MELGHSSTQVRPQKTMVANAAKKSHRVAKDRHMKASTMARETRMRTEGGGTTPPATAMGAEWVKLEALS